MKNILYITVIVLLFSSSGISAEIPDFDIGEYCKKEYGSRDDSGRSSSMAIGSCVKFEKDIKKHIQETDYPQDIVDMCIDKMSTQNTPVYFQLYQCIKMHSEMN